MRKYIAAMILCLSALLLCACGDASQPGPDVPAAVQSGGAPSVAPSSTPTAEPAQKPPRMDVDIDITEKLYVSYINEIYTNTNDYLGKVIRIEGMYGGEEYEGKQYHYIYRQGPGCCGNDGSMCGFEFTFDGAMPKDKDWIEVVGILESYEEDGFPILTIRASEVTVMDTRGAETVSN